MPINTATRQKIKRILIIIHDSLATTLALACACLVRFEGSNLSYRLSILPYLLPPFVIFALCVQHYFSLHRSKWRFASLPDLSNIIKASMVLAMTLLVIDYFLVSPLYYGGYVFGKKTIVVYCLLQMCFLGGTRLAYRYLRYARVQHNPHDSDIRLPTLLLGRVGDIELVTRAIESGAVRRIQPTGALTYRLSDLGQTIRGVPVLGHFDDLERVINELAKKGVIIRRLVATPSALSAEAQPETLLARTRNMALPLSRLSVLGDETQSAEILPLEIEDLLLRPAVAIDNKRLSCFIEDKRVLVTGGGGSIGSEMCVRLAAFGAREIIIVENSEPSLNAILESPALAQKKVRVTGLIADVRDRERIFRIVRDHTPDIVVHAAALKQVPYLEQDWEEGIKTNIFGSINVIDAVVEAKIRAFVMISTDKAVDPVSILGVTKRFAEMYAEALDARLWTADSCDHAHVTRLIAVRFGNVLGSVGSVVPKFKAQIARGGPVTVTHRDMVRYFMTIREAVELVLTAGSHADGEARSMDAGDAGRAAVYVLKMGQPVRIYELAERMIRFAGFEPNVDVEIRETGVRPGERLNEVLFATNEPLVQIGVEGVMAAKPYYPDPAKLQQWMERLRDSVHTSDRALAEQVFEEAVPGFSARSAARVAAS
ncbi:MAG: polysaccharide biosynthesis protein [Methylobacteriaceae bacterium]|nr:polysaccharide biosynthesis protein [Methylobacteriaceae bacterium]